MLKRYRKALILLLVLVAFGAAWVWWTRTPTAETSGYVPAESLAFIEVNDPIGVANGITGTEAWRVLAPPLGAPSELIPYSWSIKLARWTGIGSAEAVLLARSQFGLFFTQAQATESANTLTIKPLAALVIETHTSQNRMKAVVEKHVDQFAQRSFGEPSIARKQIDGVEIVQWKSPDNTRQLILAVVDTVAIVGNDESVVLRCIEIRRGRQPSLATNQQLQTMKQQLRGSQAPLFGFVPKAGVKAVIQAWAFARAGNVADAAAIAPLISNAFGNLIDGFAWTSRLDQSGAEDQCRVALAQGVSQQLSDDLTPEPIGEKLDFPLVPPEAISVTSYQLRNPASFWRELNAVVSSHSDVLTAVASRPLLKALLEPYGITDPDNFFPAIGPRLQLVRLDNNTPAVLIAQTFDKPALRKVAEQRLGRQPKTEKFDDTEILVGSDGWSFAFAGDYFVTGPADAVRRCLDTRARGQSIATNGSFTRARSTIDVSLPIVSLTFSPDGPTAISFVELFSSQERSAFSTNAAVIQQGAASLPHSVSVTMMKADSIEWSSRSSFGLLGSLFTAFAPERVR
ncbi:MAG TPA: hypothetical protein VGW32_07765 [Pyrinomonadaceae bacterium]|nr:hypothetical protein [Pyrinomonadaceae bacterium]